MVNRYKQIQVEEISKRLQQARNMIFVDFSNCSATNMTNFRLELNKNKLGLFVLKNSLAKLSFRKLNAPSAIIEKLNGQNAIIYGDDPIVLSKVTRSYLDKKPIVKIKLAYFEDQVCDKNIVDQYAQYNSKNDLIAVFISRIKQPVSSLVFDLKYIISKFVNVLKEVRKKNNK